jgi:hypothetical protein
MLLPDLVTTIKAGAGSTAGEAMATVVTEPPQK